MNDRELISALMDGELEATERERALALLARDPALAETWRRWQLVRSSLQHEAGDARDISAAVAARLADEPVILAPVFRPPSRRPWLAVAAVAASLAVGVGVWMARMTEPVAGDFSAFYAKGREQMLITAAEPVLSAPLDEAQRENAYIVMHAEYAHRGLQSGLRNFTRLAVADEAGMGRATVEGGL
ncbi:MAG: sigma-E factor negative regulatory protein [Pedobacter sp.]|nr:sigma-E factor negative regulatory protein [Pedobacter sp.]